MAKGPTPPGKSSKPQPGTARYYNSAKGKMIDLDTGKVTGTVTPQRVIPTKSVYAKAKPTPPRSKGPR